jgi:hypothetical protein
MWKGREQLPEMVARIGKSYQLYAWSSPGPIGKTKLSRARQSGCLTFQLAVGAGRSRRKTETVISEELQVREFHGDSLSEIGALAADEAVKLRSVMQEPASRSIGINAYKLENGILHGRPIVQEIAW